MEVKKCPKGRPAYGQYGLYARRDISTRKGKGKVVHYSGVRRMVFDDNISQSAYIMRE